MPSISIIVPVYNLQDYLPKCLNSILAQTFTDFEAILVNDGSTDGSGCICAEFAGRDSRFIVVEKANGGLSSAKNAGIEMAKGQYIGFVDADDYISPDMYEFLYNNLIGYDADISICSFYRADQNGNLHNYRPAGIIKCMEKNEAIKTLLGRRYFENYCCDKLFRKALFDGIRFPEGQNYEDVAVMYKLFDKCSRVIYHSEPKYFYAIRSGSIVNSGFNVNKLNFAEECKRIIDFSESKGGIYNEEAYPYYVLSNLWLLYEASADKEKNKFILTGLSEQVLKYHKWAVGSRYVRKFDKLSIILLKAGAGPAAVGKIHAAAKKINNIKYRIVRKR